MTQFGPRGKQAIVPGALTIVPGAVAMGDPEVLKGRGLLEFSTRL